MEPRGSVEVYFTTLPLGLQYVNTSLSCLFYVAYHTPPAIFLSAEHGLFPLQSSKSGVHALHQLVSVLQLYQLEGLFSPNAHYYRVGKRAGALCFLYGQHLMKKSGKTQSETPRVKQEQWRRLFPDIVAGTARRPATGKLLKYCPAQRDPVILWVSFSQTTKPHCWRRECKTPSCFYDY